jgi:uncharacterized protein YjbI with pentapeptide repeats
MTDLRECSVTEFSDVEVIRAESLVKKLDPARFDLTDYFGLDASHRTYGKEFDGEKIKKCHFEFCTFSDVAFVGAMGASCSFRKCSLTNCVVRDTCFDFADFSGTTISVDVKGENFQSSGFVYSNFSDAVIDNVEFRGCNFDSSHFGRTRISNARFNFCNFENACFDGTTFINTDLSNASIDFSMLREVSFDNVKLSMISLLHSFYGLQNAEKFSTSTVVKLPSSDVEIGFAEFIDKLNDMQPFFFRINDFFALSTSSIYFGNHDLAYKYIRHGLSHSLKYRDFRMIGYYCKLASLNHFFTRDQLKQLYEGLRSGNIVQSMTSHEYDVYTYELDRIRRILVDRPFGLPQVSITIATSVSQDNIDGASRITAHLSQLLKMHLPESNNYITIRHNSPFDFVITISDHISNLYGCALLISTSFFGLTPVILRYQKIIFEHLRIKGMKLDIEKKKIEVEMAKLDADLRRERQSEPSAEASLIPVNKQLHLPAALADQVLSVKLTVSADVNVDQRIRDLTFTR